MPPKKKVIESVDEEFLKHIAQKHGLSLFEASLSIDKCIQMTAASLNISYATVYANIFPNPSTTSVGTVLSKSNTHGNGNTKKDVDDTVHDAGSILVKEGACDKMAIEECNKSSTCFFLEPYGCLSRILPDADKINEDPDKYILANLTKLEDLRRIVQIAAYLHYNFDGGGLTDNSFDALEWYLKKKEVIKGRAYEKIGALPVPKIRKRLSRWMPSLSKVKPGTRECTAFLSQFIGSAFVKPVPCAWSLKLDGVSGQITYYNGKLVEINTRGDGITGGDVTYLADYIPSIPKQIQSTAYEVFVMRGEFVIARDTWEQKYKGTYTFPRSFVIAKVNAGYVSPGLQDIDFVAYEIVYESLVGDTDKGKSGLVPQPSQAFKILAVEGFIVVDNGLLYTPTVFEIMELYKKKRSEARYSIDGIILSTDKARKGIPELDPSITETRSPDHSVAFKMLLESQIRKTKILNIEWNITRNGRYFPRAVYEAVYIDGARYTHASGKSARYITNNSIGRGTQITIKRSGDVIPVMSDPILDAKIDTILPPTADEGGYDWSWEKNDIVLDEIETNREVLIKRAIHFFETIGVARLGPKTIEKLHEAGMKTPESIVNASVADFIKIKGIAKKTAESYYFGIRKALSVVPPDRLIVASSVFKSGMGIKLLKLVFKEIPTLLDMDGDQIKAFFAKKKIAGFAAARIKLVSDGIPEFRKYLDGFAKEYIEQALVFYAKRIKHLNEKGRNPLIEGKYFVTTNFMGKQDCELEDYMFDHNGITTDSVSTKVSAVICGNIEKITEKMTAAAEIEIPVLTLQEFCERFNVPLKKFQKEEVKDEEED